MAMMAMTTNNSIRVNAKGFSWWEFSYHQARLKGVLVVNLPGDIVQSHDDLLGFFARRSGGEDKHSIGDRRPIRGGQPAAVLRFAGAVLRKDADSPAAVLRGDAVQNERTVTVVLNPNSKSAIARVNDGGIGHTLF